MPIKKSGKQYVLTSPTHKKNGHAKVLARGTKAQVEKRAKQIAYFRGK